MRWLPGLIGAVTVGWLVPPVAYTLIGSEPGTVRGNPVLVLVLAAAVGALHLRHAVPVARGELPRGWPWTLVALAAAVYLPLLWWSWDWISMQVFAAASVALVVQRRLGLAAAAVLVAAPVVADTVARLGSATVVLQAVYDLVGVAVAAGSLYAAPHLVRVTAELRAGRAALAEAAVGAERLRVSRDLHDLLGQSLSAVSLKGDLALAVLARDPERARSEVAGVAEVARDALRDLRAVARDEHPVSLRSELARAAGVLEAAGVRTTIAVDEVPPGAAAERLLGWAVREGVTNVLRHSTARTCSVTTSGGTGTIRLVIVNDGATGGGDGDRSGLTSLAERAEALSGTVAAGRAGDRFRLTVELPEDAP